MTPSNADPARPERETMVRGLQLQEDLSLAINAYLMADKALSEGSEKAEGEKRQHLRNIENRYWRSVLSILSTALANRQNALEFSDEERLLFDLGLFDVRMLGGDRDQTFRDLVAELTARGLPGCYYLSEWLANRHQQLQLEQTLSGPDDGEENYVSQLVETRRRVLSRLAAYFAGLPGIPLEVSEAMRSGELDNAIIANGIAALGNPRRSLLLRRHNLWQLRDQVLAKAKARTNSQNILRLFEMLDEIYVRDWRERYDGFVTEGVVNLPAPGQTKLRDASSSVSNANPGVDMLASELRQIRMRTVLTAVVDGKAAPDNVMVTRAQRITKQALADFLPLAQAFDRSLSELPPILIVPGSGRGFFAWETGCVMVSLRPIVGIDDSVATGFAWLRMLDDRFNNGGRLRQTFEKTFPGAVFHNDFPAEYRAWLCRLTKGETSAMNPQRRAFFREHIGPDITGPMLPPNLRNVGPQTMIAICRRLEKQLASGDNDAKLHRRLASLYWQQGNMEAAGLQFNAAMQLAPDDGETLFAAGMFMRSRGDGEAANDCFRFGAERAPSSLWGIYCQDALANQI